MGQRLRQDRGCGREASAGQRLHQDRDCGGAEAVAEQKSERAPKLKASDRGLLVKMGGGREAERTLNERASDKRVPTARVHNLCTAVAAVWGLATN